MTVHNLKIWPEFYAEIVAGRKNFELRKNDRNYAPGDELILQEWEPKTETYTGRDVRRFVLCVQHGMNNQGVIPPLRGLNLGYVVLGLTDSPRDEGHVGRLVLRADETAA